MAASIALKPWISAEPFRSDSRQSILANSEYSEARLFMKRELSSSFRRDREIFCSERPLEMQPASVVGDSRKLFRLVRATCKKAFPMTETIFEADGSLICNPQRRFVRFDAHFSCPPASAPPTTIPQTSGGRLRQIYQLRRRSEC